MGTRMAGPGIRYSRFAAGLAATHDVTLLLCQPPEEGFEIPGVRIVACGPHMPFDPRVVGRLAREAEVVITEPIGLSTIAELGRSGARIIFDVYVPTYIEALSQQAGEAINLAAREQVYVRHRMQVSAALSVGDGFLCASRRQRDLWMGALAALGRVDVASYIEDPSWDHVISVVPFGSDPEPPTRLEGRGLRGVIPGIEQDDELLLWAGGVWNWFDPLTVIRAVDAVVRRRPSVKLCFMGVGHPSPLFPQMRMTGEAIGLASSLGLTDRHVFFNHDWVPYAERGSLLADADIGVSAHFRSLETDYSYRTRLLDHFWAGLPTLTTEGGELSELVERERIGATVPERDVHAWAAAITDLLDDPAGRADMAERAREVASRYAWPKLVDDLAVAIGGVLEQRSPPRLPIGGLRRRNVRAALRAHTALRGPLSTVRYIHHLVRS